MYNLLYIDQAQKNLFKKNPLTSRSEVFHGSKHWSYRVRMEGLGGKQGHPDCRFLTGSKRRGCENCSTLNRCWRETWAGKGEQGGCDHVQAWDQLTDGDSLPDCPVLY